MRPPAFSRSAASLVPTRFPQRLEACNGVLPPRAPATMVQALAAMADEAADLDRGRRASIWLHDRRAGDLRLAACPVPGRQLGPVAADDPGTPAALGLTLDRPMRDAGASAPHRGAAARLAPGARHARPRRTRRRASSTPSRSLELAHEVARQLSAAIENIQLLEEVVRQHRLLEDTLRLARRSGDRHRQRPARRPDERRARRASDGDR